MRGWGKVWCVYLRTPPVRTRGGGGKRDWVSVGVEGVGVRGLFVGSKCGGSVLSTNKIMDICNRLVFLAENVSRCIKSVKGVGVKS